VRLHAQAGRGPGDDGSREKLNSDVSHARCAI
jgi:hypothetical protein